MIPVSPFLALRLVSFLLKKPGHLSFRVFHVLDLMDCILTYSSFLHISYEVVISSRGLIRFTFHILARKKWHSLSLLPSKISQAHSVTLVSALALERRANFEAAGVFIMEMGLQGHWLRVVQGWQRRASPAQRGRMKVHFPSRASSPGTHLFVVSCRLTTPRLGFEPGI